MKKKQVALREEPLWCRLFTIVISWLQAVQAGMSQRKQLIMLKLNPDSYMAAGSPRDCVVSHHEIDSLLQP
jgi:hypothetical protein